MPVLEAQKLLTSETDCKFFDTSMRILHIEDGHVWVIPVAFGKGQKYACGPQWFGEELINELIREKRLIITEFSPPAHWLLDEADLNRLYSGDPNVRCPMIVQRDDAYKAIYPYVSENSVSEAVKTMSYRSWIRARSLELNRTPTWIYHNLHLYWAGGSTQAALLGNTLYCGGRDSAKVQNSKLGRPNVSVIAARSQNPSMDTSALEGFVMTEEDIKKVQFGWSFFLPGRSVRERYLETMAAFYRQSIEIDDDGKQRVVLLPANQRPTLRQFEYWGKKTRNRESSGSSFRPVPVKAMGNANQTVLKIGQLGWADSSDGDVELTSISSRLVRVGTGTYLAIIEARTEVICGVYIGFERPSAKTALLAVAHAAMSKTAWCERFGIAGVTDNHMPPVRLDRIFTDNGELRNYLTMDVSLEAWEGWITYAPAGVPEAKGPIEGDHHVRHSIIDHQLSGTTHGRPKQHGEPDPASEAALNMFEWTHLHIKRILYHNTMQSAPHLLTGEMRKDLTASATRMDIFLWLKKNGYINGAPPSPDLIRAKMLPRFSATITSRGILLHKPDCGKKPQILNGCRFMSDDQGRSTILANALIHGKNIHIHMDPNDLTVAWLPTLQGLLPLKNVYRDDMLISRGSIYELCTIQNSDRLVMLNDRTRQDQCDFELMQTRESVNRAAVAGRDRERAAVESGLLPDPALSNNGETSSERRKAETRKLEEHGMTCPVAVTSHPVTLGDQPLAVPSPPVEASCAKLSRTSAINNDTRAAINAFKRKRSPL